MSGFVGMEPRAPEDDPSETIRVERTYPVSRETRRRWARELEAWRNGQRQNEEEDDHDEG